MSVIHCKQIKKLLIKIFYRYFLGIREDYYRIEVNFDSGSAYQYTFQDKIPYIIKFGRKHDGKFETGKINGDMNYIDIYNLMFMLKRGYSLQEIKSTFKIL